MSYLVGLIDRSKSPFDVELLVSKVFDEHFVPSKQYSDAIASRIPHGKRAEVLDQLVNRRAEGKIEHLTLFARSILSTLSDEQKASFWEMISGELEEALGDVEVRTALSLSSENWDRLSELARLRTEHRLIESIKKGAYDPETNGCSGGSLGTWASRISPQFLLKGDLRDALVNRLYNGGPAAIAYVLRFFRSDLSLQTNR